MALLQRLRWQLNMLRLALTLRPIRGGAEDDGGDGGDDAGKDAKADAGKSGGGDDKDKGGKDDKTGKTGKSDDDADKGDDDKVDPDDDWKTKSRKHERGEKAAIKRAEKAEQEAEKLRKANQSAEEKAREEAKEEAAKTARSDALNEQRPRLRKAEIRAAAAGKFADVDDAVKLVDIDDDDLFDEDGEIDQDALKSALDDLLEKKPHLKVDPNDGRPSGDDDAGKGGGGGGDLESMSTEDHLKEVQKKDR